MNTNPQFQNRHAENPDNNWILIQQIERDICYLYHQLSSYSNIMGDLYFDDIYDLPYWEFVNVSERELRKSEEDTNFFREGCLMLILTMAWERIAGAGTYINNKIDIILHYLKQFEPANKSQIKLLETCVSVVKYAQKADGNLEMITEKSNWAHKEFVRGYYRRIVHRFDINP